MECAVEVRDLCKQFTAKKGPLFKRVRETTDAVKDVSFSIAKGEIFSLLGPNGAGKTTTIKMLATLLIPTAGLARVMGYDVIKQDSDVRRILTAVLPGERTLYWKLTVRENLLYFGALYGLNKRFVSRRIGELLGYF